MLHHQQLLAEESERWVVVPREQGGAAEIDREGISMQERLQVGRQLTAEHIDGESGHLDAAREQLKR
jgi:hypothetical protein